MSEPTEAAALGDVEPTQTRARMQRGLLYAAELACIYKLTDGFCHPRNRPECRCWDAANAVMKATGLSAQAVHWIFQHIDKIEKDAMPDAGPITASPP